MIGLSWVSPLLSVMLTKSASPALCLGWNIQDASLSCLRRWWVWLEDWASWSARVLSSLSPYSFNIFPFPPDPSMESHQQGSWTTYVATQSTPKSTNEDLSGLLKGQAWNWHLSCFCYILLVKKVHGLLQIQYWGDCQRAWIPRIVVVWGPFLEIHHHNIWFQRGHFH